MLINIGKRYFRNVVFLATWSLFPWQQPKIDKNTKIPTDHQICKNNNAYQHKILLNLKKIDNTKFCIYLEIRMSKYYFPNCFFNIFHCKI